MYSVAFGLNGSSLVFRVLFPGVVGHDARIAPSANRGNPSKNPLNIYLS